ncbi:MAG: hypothetical protein WEB58_04710 [Planctomycetaceae bacterium]
MSLEGIVVRGKGNTPVESARVSIRAGETELVAGDTDTDGKYSLSFKLPEDHFSLSLDDKLLLRTDLDETLMIYVELDGEKPVTVPFPRMAVDDLDQAYVLVSIQPKRLEQSVPADEAENGVTVDDSVEATR